MAKLVAKKKMGRPKITVDWEKFEFACSLLATKAEICGLLKINETTLQRRIKEKYNDTFEGVLKKIGGDAKVSLRRNQFNLSKTNAGMAIFLGKNYLNQRDRFDNEEDTTPETVDFEYEEIE